MTYELAKKLKDAGFPQVGKGYIELHWPPHKVESYTKSSPITPVWEEAIYFPTLSQLIEACGDVSLFRYKGQDKWQAEGGELKVNKETMQGGYALRVLGNTPEEAVAKLWLALNPHTDIT